MKSVERRFEKKRKEAESTASDYIVFARTVKDQGFTRDTIKEWFYELVPTKEYQGSSHREVIDHLEAISNGEL